MTRSSDPAVWRPLRNAVASWREGSAPTRVMRLFVYAAAVLLGAMTYRAHLDPHAQWSNWVAEFLLGAILMIVALWSGEPPAGGRLRWLARLAGAMVAGGTGWAAVALSAQPGRELEAGLSIVAAMIGFLVFRWVPFDPRDLQALLGDRRAALFAGAALRRTVPLAIAAVALAIAATVYNPLNHELGFALWLAGMAAFAAAFWPSDRSGGPNPWQHAGGPQLSLRSERLGLFLIVLLAIALRVTILDEVPAWISPDEGRLGRYAERMWADGFPDAFGLGWNAFPNLSYMLLYSWVQALGTSNPHLRLSAAMVGVVSLVPMFYWVRSWWGNVIALIATFLLAINQTHLMWSRIGFNNIHQILVAALILLCFARVLRGGRAIDWVWLGFAAGLSFHTYHAAKMLPALLVPIGVLFAVGIRGFTRRYLPGMAIGAVAFVLCLGPLIRTTIENWSFFYGNTSNRVDLSQLIEAHRLGNVQAVRDYIHRHVYTSLAAFTSLPTPADAYLSVFTAVPFALGIAWMLWRWRDPRHLTVLVWIAGILVLGGMITDYPPATTRMLGFFPAVCVVPAVVAGHLRGLLSRWRKVGDAVFAILLVGWLGGAAYTTWYDFFVTAPPKQRGQAMSEICRVIRRAPRPVTLYMVGGDSEAEPKVAAHDCMIADDEQRRFVNLTKGPAVVPMPPDHHGYAVIMVLHPQREIAPIIARSYPEARYEVVYDPSGLDVLHVFTLSPQAVELHRGLRAEYRGAFGFRLSDRAVAAFAAPSGMDFPLRAEWRGQLFIPAPGAYSLRSSAGELRVDDRPVESTTFRSLAAGWHSIEIATEFAGADDPAIALEWQQGSSWIRVPAENLNDRSSAGGLLGRYFDRVIASERATPIDAAADYESIDAAISFHYRTESDEQPPPPFAALPSTMEWTGTVDFAGRPRRLRLQATTPTVVFVDGELVVDARQAGAVEVDLPAKAGSVPLLVRNVRPRDDDWRVWELRLLWQEPGAAWSATAGYELPSQLR